MNFDPKTDHLEHTQWKPGQSGNPAGSSQKQRLTNLLIRTLEENGLAASFVRVGVEAAVAGDFNYWRYIFDRVDGRIPEAEPLPNIDTAELVSRAAAKAAARLRERAAVKNADANTATPAGH
jgi:hypothetical protein